MKEALEEIGGDGFLIYDPLTRIAISEVADVLAPALKKRGLLKEDYSQPSFRANLLAF